MTLFVCFTYKGIQAKSVQVTQLEKEVYFLNNQAEYEQSFKKITEFLKKNNISNEDAYYGNLFLSETYKRVFDYSNVLVYLDVARNFADKINKDKEYYIDNINTQKAFALFDIKRYNDAAILMNFIEKNNYRNLNSTNKAYIIMQRAYLYQLNKNYVIAEQKYDEAIQVMQTYNRCDLPVIYGKKIALYGLLNKPELMQQCYTLAIKYADSCNITKYHLYAAEMMRNTYKDVLKDYVNGYKYFDKYDSLSTIYKADDFKQKLNELNIKYNTEKKEAELILSKEIITSNNRYMAFLISGLLVALLIIALGLTIYKRKKIEIEQKHTQIFTKQLFNKTEEERKRIAFDIHDGVNNELLLIKNSLQITDETTKNKIDNLMNTVRIISRNLHPVLFEEVGLQESIEQLVERVQENNKFILNTEIDYKGCLTSADELQLYRIIQESVNNIIKYSKAEAAIITINQYKEKLIVEIKDNGKGFNVNETLANKKSFGLHNIIERSKAINGNASITSNQNGTTIKIEIPILN